MKVITEESFKKFLRSIRKDIPCDIERDKIDWPEAFDVQLVAVQCEVQFPKVSVEDINITNSKKYIGIERSKI